MKVVVPILISMLKYSFFQHNKIFLDSKQAYKEENFMLNIGPHMSKSCKGWNWEKLQKHPKSGRKHSTFPR
jgi:hypothetical protein